MPTENKRAADRWQELKFEIDHLIYQMKDGDEFVEPTMLASLLVAISTYKINLQDVGAELGRDVALEKSRRYYKLVAQGNSKTAAEKEATMGDEYIQRQYLANLISGYIREVSALVMTAQTYLKWKSQEANL